MTAKPYYQDDLVTLYHGDCWEGMDALADASIDLILTDPPYNVTESNGRDGTTVGKVKRADGSYREIQRDFGSWDRGFDPARLTAVAERVLVNRGGFIAFASDRLIGGYFDSPLHHMRTLVWMKTNPSPQFPGNYQSALEWIVWQGKNGPPRFNGGGAVPNIYNAPIPSLKRHPNEKPQSIIEKLILMHSEPGDLILDMFAGSGTTLRAAADTGRRCIGFEDSEAHCETIAKRLQQQAFDFGALA